MNKAIAARSLALLICIGGCQSTPDQAWDLPPGVKSLAVDGYPVAYVERGTGPTVVLVHGSLNDYRYWMPQMEPLASQFRVVSVSLRHYYPERWKGEGEFSFKRHAEDLAAFIEGLGGGAVHVVGWSRGGNVAVEMARSRPELIRKLVLMDPALDILVKSPESAKAEDERLRRAKTAQGHFAKGEMEAGLQYFFDTGNSPGAWSRLPEDQRQNRRDNAWTIVGQLGDVERVDCPDIARFKMPVLLMGGEQSPARYNRIRAAFQQCLPASTSVTIPKAAHQMNQMNPTAFNAALIKFLSE